MLALKRSRLCTKCAVEKDITFFGKDKYGKDGYRGSCKDCHKKACQRWREKYPEKYEAIKKNTNVYKRHGVTVTWYQDTYNHQAGRCAVCAAYQPQLNIDHDHLTGKIRGLLCGGCNLAIGHSKDSPKILRNLANYLEVNK